MGGQQALSSSCRVVSSNASVGGFGCVGGSGGSIVWVGGWDIINDQPAPPCPVLSSFVRTWRRKVICLMASTVLGFEDDMSDPVGFFGGGGGGLGEPS